MAHAASPQRLLGFPNNETHLPTFQNPPRPYSRLSGSHEDPWWPRCHQRPSCQGPQASGGLIVGGCKLALQRLKTRPQFQAVLAGVTLVRTPHFALHRVALSGSTPSAPDASPLFAKRDVWLGAMVPKRWAKRAVTRNSIKRLVYAVSLDFEANLACAAHVVRLRSSFDRQHFVSATSPALKIAVRQELQQLFSKAATAPPLTVQPGAA